MGVAACVSRRKIRGRSNDCVDSVLDLVGEAVPVMLQCQRKGEPFQARMFRHLHLSILKVAVSDGRDDHDDLNFAAVGVHAPTKQLCQYLLVGSDARGSTCVSAA